MFYPKIQKYEEEIIIIDEFTMYSMLERTKLER